MAGLVRVTGTGQLLDLQRRLQAAGGPRLARNFSRRVRRAAEPTHRDMRSEVLGLRIAGTGRKGTGGPTTNTRPLRATIAAAVRLSVRASSNPGARIWIDRGSLPPDLKFMPDRLNDGEWRHPVFGNRHRWVPQTASPAFWWDWTVTKNTPRMTAEVERVLNDVRNSLE